jgi:hypothetical protein
MEYKLKSIKIRRRSARPSTCGAWEIVCTSFHCTGRKLAPLKNTALSPSYAAKTQLSKCKKRSNTRLLIGFKDPGVRNAP